QTAAERRLATTRFADDAEALSRVQVERDPVDGMQGTPRCAVGDRQVADLEDGSGGRGRAGGERWRGLGHQVFSRVMVCETSASPSAAAASGAGSPRRRGTRPLKPFTRSSGLTMSLSPSPTRVSPVT